MNELPIGPGEAIPLVSWSPGLVRALVVMGLLWLAWRLLRRWWANRPPPEPAPQESTPRREKTLSPFEKELAVIRTMTSRSQDWRGGLHALARAIRETLEGHSGLQVEEMTAEEIAQAFEAAAVGEAMRALRDARFDAAPVTKKTFETECERAERVFRGAKAFKTRSGQ